MTAEIIVLLLGAVGLALTGILLAREHDARVRLVSVLGATLAFGLALLMALLAGKGLLVGVAVGSIGAATLALVLIGQWRLIHVLTRAGSRQ